MTKLRSRTILPLAVLLLSACTNDATPAGSTPSTPDLELAGNPSLSAAGTGTSEPAAAGGAAGSSGPAPVAGSAAAAGSGGSSSATAGTAAAAGSAAAGSAAAGSAAAGSVAGTGGVTGAAGAPDLSEILPPLSTPDNRPPAADNPPECPAVAPEDPVGDCAGLPVYLACNYGSYSCTCDWYHWLCFG